MTPRLLQLPLTDALPNVPTAGVVLLLDTDPARGAALDGRLGRFGLRLIHVDSRSAPRPLQRPVDVAIVELGADRFDALARAYDQLLVDQATEVLFCAERDGPEVAIARGLGIDRIVPCDDLGDWLADAAPHLVKCARASRTLLEAERHIPPIPRFDSPSSTLPLATAEQRFREAYLRRLLVPGATREAVARAAGVPYRTLCQMLRKLGIDFPARRRGRRTGSA